MNEFIITDIIRRDLACCDAKTYIDLDIGDTNDFVLSTSLDNYNAEIHKAGNYIYCAGTEFGGILSDTEINTTNNSIQFSGDTFRGMLNKKVIMPPNGSDYKIISGELNSVIKTLVGSQFDDLFTFSTESTGVKVTNYQFNRYCTLLDGLTDLLNSVNYKLSIKVVDSDTFTVLLSALHIKDYSEEIETSQDSNINFKIAQNTNKYNYMICLGKGELKSRTVIILYRSKSGSYSTVTTIPNGINSKVYVYDYSSAESAAELKQSGIEKFKEINKQDSQSMTIPDDWQLDLGDVVSGKDYTTNISVVQPITDIILKLENGKIKTSYKVGEDND